jgi:copper chaperone
MHYDGPNAGSHADSRYGSMQRCNPTDRRGDDMKFSVKKDIRTSDVSTIEHAMKTVDADAKVEVNVDKRTVSVDSWLMPEEFLVAFDDENYDVVIVEA